MSRQTDKRIPSTTPDEPRMTIAGLLGVPVPPKPSPSLPVSGAPAAPAPAKKWKGPPIEIWISKQGRAGKAVSLLKSNVNGAEAQTLLVALKRRLAVGGALKDGEILLQTADRARVALALQDQGYPSKICGG
ncbi:MAG: hypothetical protein J0L75_18060 [Spirochaetes bacterium]|nr:hypothetical protein [Spirochaetota bacterium]